MSAPGRVITNRHKNSYNLNTKKAGSTSIFPGIAAIQPAAEAKSPEIKITGKSGMTKRLTKTA